jgi:hypothetical protein
MLALTREEYKALYPNQTDYATTLATNISYPGNVMIKHGLLKFTDETAYRWSGPFEGGYAVFRIQDFTNGTIHRHQGKGKNVIEYFEQCNEERKAKAARSIYPNQRYYPLEDIPTREFPVELRMYGNDDTSWTKWYRSVEEALEEFALFEMAQPLDFDEVIRGFGFSFTN